MEARATFPELPQVNFPNVLCLEGGWGTGKGGGTTPCTGNYLTTRHPDGALSDPAVVASCIPGATLTKAGANGVYQGTMHVKFGPTVAQFRGEASLTYDHAAQRCSAPTIHITAKGIFGAAGPLPRNKLYTRSGDGGRTSLGDGATFLRSRFRSEAFIQCRGRALRRDAETAPRAAKRRPGL